MIHIITNINHFFFFAKITNLRDKTKQLKQFTFNIILKIFITPSNKYI